MADVNKNSNDDRTVNGLPSHQKARIARLDKNTSNYMLYTGDTL